MDGLTITFVLSGIAVCVAALVVLGRALHSAQRVSEARTEGDGKLIKQLADTLAVIAKDESQLRRTEIATIAPAAAAYARAASSPTPNGLHRSHVEPPEGGEEVHVRGV